MVYRVVSTKLTEEEHTKLLDACNSKGCTPSAMIKEAILEKVELKDDVKSSEKRGVIFDSQLKKFLGVKKDTSRIILDSN